MRKIHNISFGDDRELENKLSQYKNIVVIGRFDIGGMFKKIIKIYAERI